MRVLLVFGTRPEAIKMAPLVKAFQSDSRFIVSTCVTAQHREMLDQVLNLFEISPDFDLDIMRPGQTLPNITSEIIARIDVVLKEFKPDLVFVHGDTTTSFSAALSAYYNRIPVAHIEAGLRTGDIYSPWPEEANRRLIGTLARWHFAPTEIAKNNLLREDVPDANIVITGNTVIDALFWVKDKLEASFAVEENLWPGFAKMRPTSKKILITAHRRENFGKGFTEIFSAIAELSVKFPEVDFVYPVHMNPNVRGPARNLLSNLSNVHLCEPLDYLPFVHIMTKSHIILTDSGGIQEEAPALGKPVLLLRNNTERPEAVEAGTVKLVGTNRTEIVSSVSLLLESECAYSTMSHAKNPYGDGNACLRIIEKLVD